MKRNCCIGSSAGLWYPDQLIGATVRIKSLSVGIGKELPPVSSGDLYNVEYVNFLVNPKTGELKAAVTLEGVSGWVFDLADLEILRVDTFPRIFTCEFNEIFF